MNDVQFSDTPLTTGMLADYCRRFPNSPACSHLMGSGPGGNHNGGNSGHHDHHDHHDHNDAHHGGSQGGHHFHPLS